MASKDAVRLAATALKRADALMVTAGAGMGCDSGLPDFRGPEGFWKAYPPIKELGLSFPEVSTPKWLRKDPPFFWGFFGHRANLYSSTEPHRGFKMLLDWGKSMPHGYSVFTSNIDGHFQRSGFDPAMVYECHGRITHLQCAKPCSFQTWLAEDIPRVDVDPATFRASEPLPTCPRCGGHARPNVLMFGDMEYVEDNEEQERNINAWVRRLPAEANLVIVEIGAGLAVPTVRYHGENILGKRKQSKKQKQKHAGTTTLLRINPREPEGPRGTVSLAGPGLQTLDAIAEEMKRIK